MRATSTRRVVIIALAGILAMLGLFAAVGAAGCGVGNGTESSAGGGSAAVEPGSPGGSLDDPYPGQRNATDASGADQALSDESKGAASGGAGALAVSGALEPVAYDPARFLVRTGQMTLVVPKGDVDETAADIARVTNGLGGYVMSSQLGTTPDYYATPLPVEPAASDELRSSQVEVQASGERFAVVTVRIPARYYDQAVNRFRQLGEVRDFSSTSDDVTGQFVDLQARLRHYRAVEKRLLSFLARTKTIGEALSVQERIDAVQLQVEELGGQLKAMRETVLYGTLSVTVTEKHGKPHAAAAPAGTSFLDALRGSLDVIATGARATFVALGAILPFALLALGVFLAWRVAGKRLARRQTKPGPPEVGRGTV